MKMYRKALVALASLTVFTAAIAGCGYPADDTMSIGKPVEEMPKEAAFAVAMGPTQLGFSGTDILDHSYIVFLDKDAEPLGHLEGPGVFRTQMARTDKGFIYFDGKAATHVTRDNGIESIPLDRDGMVQMSNSMSQESGSEAAAIFIDDGFSSENSKGYASTLVSYSPSAGLSVLNIDGSITASAVCESSIFYITGSGQDGSNQQLFSVTPGQTNPKYINDITSKEGVIDEFSDWIPALCNQQNSADFYQDWGTSTDRLHFIIHSGGLGEIYPMPSSEIPSSLLGGTAASRSSDLCSIITRDAECFILENDWNPKVGRVDFSASGVGQIDAASFVENGTFSFIGREMDVLNSDDVDLSLYDQALYSVLKDGSITMVGKPLGFDKTLWNRSTLVPWDLLVLRSPEKWY